MCVLPMFAHVPLLNHGQGKWAQCLVAVQIPKRDLRSVDSSTDYGLCSTAVGLIMGFIFGTYLENSIFQASDEMLRQSKGGFNIMRYGAGPSGPMRTLGQYMLGSGATFGYVRQGHCNSRGMVHLFGSSIILISVLLSIASSCQ